MIEHGGNLFAVAHARGWNWRDVLDFSASINPLGPSSRVKPAIEAALERIVHYPEPQPRRLAAELARQWDLGAAQVLLGNGATELIHFLARCGGFATQTLALPTFSEFRRAWPNADHCDAADPESWPREGLLVVTQPNNPTGEAIDNGALERVIRGRQDPVLVDESFLEFTDLPSSLPLAHELPNLLVLRSLTKFQALPGLRIGALAGSRVLIDMLRPSREPWQVNVLAEAAALAALSDTDHARATREYVGRERARFAAALGRLHGVRTTPGCANYVFFHVERSARELAAALLETRILVRVCSDEPGVEGQALRVAVKREQDNDRLLEVLGDLLR